MPLAHPLVHLNAALNTVAAILLVVGLVLIRGGRETAHKRVMLGAFAVSTLFLACYLWYHYNVGHVEFGGTGWVRTVYLAILLSHILLAITVPPLAILTIVFGWRALSGHPAATTYRHRHRRLARITFPIWLYVSITGVIVYVMLYHLWPPLAP